jgi:uncharacterized protein DUF4229
MSNFGCGGYRAAEAGGGRRSGPRSVASVGEQFDDDINRGNPSLPEVPPHIARDLCLYVLARFVLVGVVATILVLINVPLLISIMVGLVLGLPVSMLLFRGWHDRVARALAARGMVRRAARDRLRAELRGETGP